ncbi:MAG: DMT family transporter [Cohaesibacter sp.]|nr:DMT family transporter [Cohaesibacter sp.]
MTPSATAIRKPTPADLSSLLLLAFIWASAFLAIKVAVPQTGPVWLAALRVIIGFLVLLPWMLYRGIILPKGAKNWIILLFFSLINVTIPFLLISWAELTISAGVTSLLLGSGPLLALVLAHFTTKDDKISWPKLLGIAFGFSGIALVVGGQALNDVEDTALLALLAVLAASFCYALSGALVRKITDIPPTRLATLVLGLCSLQLLALGLWEGLPNFEKIDAKSWACLIYLGLLPTGLATILRYRLIRTVGASFFALGLNLIPVFGVIMGALILSETVPIEIWGALVLIVTGLFVTRIPQKHP